MNTFKTPKNLMKQEGAAAIPILEKLNYKILKQFVQGHKARNWQNK